MKKTLILSALLLCSVLSFAFEVDGINYKVISTDELTVGVSSNKQCSGDIVIPEKVTYEEKEYSVISIEKGAFYGCSGLTSVTIPNSVTSIGNSAFWYCSGLISLAIPNSVTDIEEYAFKGCSGLTSVTIPNSVITIGVMAFDGCSGLTSLTIPNSVTTIGRNAFSGCSGLTSVTIPNSVTSIGSSAFYGCSGLTSLTIPNSVTSIERSAFSHCSGLTSVTIPESVITIGDYAFSDCSGLTLVTIPNSVTSIGEGAFSGCFGLTSLTIPNSVATIGETAFFDCIHLTSIIVDGGNGKYDSRDNCNAIIETASNTLIAGCINSIIPNSVTTIGDWAFGDCNGLTSVAIPNSVTSIGYYAFAYCSSLKSVTIPNSVISIGEGAFVLCSHLTSLTIPNSVTSIGDDAFYCCSSLTEVVSLIEEPFEITDRVFKSAYNATLYVPIGTKEKYEATAAWNQFAKIEERGVAPEEAGEVNYGGDGEVNGDTDLSGTVVGNVFYSIADGAGNYSSTDGCIVVKKPTTDEQVSQVEGTDLFGEQTKDNFTGIIFKVEPGSGAVKVMAETTGDMTLKIKIGDSAPMEFKLNGKMEAKLPYTVEKPTYVYIYAGGSEAAGAKGTRATADGVLKIYGISWGDDAVGIEAVENGEQVNADAPVYNLNGQRVSKAAKGVFIKNGRKVIVK